MEDNQRVRTTVTLDIETYMELLTNQKQPAQSTNTNPVISFEVGDKYQLEDKSYAKLLDTKIKVRGVLEKFIAHPKIGPAIKSAITPEEANEIGKNWLPVVVYACLYDNPDGEVWVRMKEEFDSKFKKSV